MPHERPRTYTLEEVEQFLLLPPFIVANFCEKLLSKPTQRESDQFTYWQLAAFATIKTSWLGDMNADLSPLMTEIRDTGGSLAAIFACARERGLARYLGADDKGVSCVWFDTRSWGGEAASTTTAVALFRDWAFGELAVANDPSGPYVSLSAFVSAVERGAASSANAYRGMNPAVYVEALRIASLLRTYRQKFPYTEEQRMANVLAKTSRALA